MGDHCQQQCSLDCLREEDHYVINSNEKGRCLMAAKSYDIGDVILSNVPYTHVLFDRCLEERCSYCFVKSSTLSACSKCKYVRYCSRECQAAGWMQHKMECKLIAKMAKIGMVNAGRSIDTDFRLLVGTYGVLQSDTSTQCRVDSSGRSICGSSHLKSMPSAGSVAKFQQDMPLLDFISTVMKVKVPVEDLTSMLLRFHCNNFGITNALIDCIGAGVYPCAALLNHSCAPNCVLRYVVEAKTPVTLQIVAVRPVVRGEEICHSYTELVETAESRRAALWSTYQFTCAMGSCMRCHGAASPVSVEASASLHTRTHTAPSPTHTRGYSSTVQLSAAFVASGSYEVIIDEVVAGAGGALPAVLVNVDDMTTALLPGKLAGDCRRVLQEVHEYSRCHITRASSVEDEIQVHQHCRVRLAEVVGPFHIELYKTHGQLLTAYLETGEWASALSMCYHVVGFLYMVFSSVLPHHPLLGLQLYTLGDILSQNDQMVPEGMIVYSRARNILRATHGPADDLVLRLDALLKE